jgi:hypothetical protein
VRWAGICDSLFPIDVEELLTERGMSANHTTIWRSVQCYAPALNKRCRRELKPTNGSWRVDETYVRLKGKWVYLYRAVDSTGATIDFLLSAHRDAAAAKRSFQRALRAPGHPRPRAINVDGKRSYPKVIAELRDVLQKRLRARTTLVLRTRLIYSALHPSVSIDEQDQPNHIPCGQNIQAGVDEFMMELPHARQQMGSALGVRHRLSQSEAP